jgi:fructosamine-3-kinase
LNEAQRSLDVARREIEELKQQATDNSKSQQRVSSISGGGALNSVQLKELTGLGEKCMDLTQQNEVLGQEVARLHRDAQERDRGFEELGHARSEIERLRAEAKKSQNR